MVASNRNELRTTADNAAASQENNYYFFLAGLLALLCIAPGIELFAIGRTAFTLVLILFSGTLVLACWAYRGSTKLYWAGILLAGAAFFLSVVAAINANVALGYLSLIVHIAFWSLGAWIAFSHVFSPGPISLNRIVGSVCVYMMVAVVFADLAVLINWLAPGSYSNVTATGLEEQLSEFAYFSFVTINTLGYGDISPVSSVARTLAILESTFGVFYLAILVASLIGMRTSSGAFGLENSHRPTGAASSHDNGPD